MRRIAKVEERLERLENEVYRFDIGGFKKAAQEVIFSISSIELDGKQVLIKEIILALFKSLGIAPERKKEEIVIVNINKKKSR